MNWADLFERAESYGTDVETIREVLAERRKDASESEGGRAGSEDDETSSEDDDD